MSKHNLTTAACVVCLLTATVFVQARQASDARRYIAPRTSADTTLPPFSGAVFAGNTLYLSGEIGTDANQRVPDTAEAESRAVLDKVQAQAGAPPA